MNNASNVLMGATLLLVIASSVIDFAHQRIPNILTIGGASIALILHGGFNGALGIQSALTGCLLAFILFLPFYLFRWMGAGDVKLLIAIGALLGWPQSLDAFLATLTIGAAISLALIAYRGGLKRYLTRYAGMLWRLLSTGTAMYHPPATDEPAQLRFPYAFVIGLGTIYALTKSGRSGSFFETLSLALSNS